MRLAGTVIPGILALAIAGLLYQDYAAHGRNNKMIDKLISPYNYLSAAVRLGKRRWRSAREFQVIDEHPEHVPYEDPYLTVLVLVIGETARSMNFSLNGYERETNPRLAREDVISFQRVTASGTATAFALPCLFSHLPRARFKIDEAAQSENLVDVMQKAGYDVLWLDNDGGSKGVSDRVPTIDLMRDGPAAYRNGDTCYDEVLLDGLEDRIRAVTKDTVFILHMMGSHGPSYYRRYPDRFRVFTPTCDTAAIQGRPREEIVNTYDNTILYTDHVLAEVIAVLKKFPEHEAGMINLSDHGESLGENGLYLHGFPYAFAPREQLEVPMILWMSETMKREDHVDYEKLRGAAASLDLSHDNFFHSVLGLVEIDTDLYDSSLDLFTPFRTKPLPYH